LKDLGVDGRIMLKLIFKMWDRGSMDWIELAQDRGKVACSFKYGSEPSVSTKCGGLLD
jgi:hypothetical protein